MYLFRHLAALTAALLALVGPAAATPIVSTFTNSADLDFSGNFTYALTMNPNANGQQIGDASFTYAVGGATPGVSEFHRYYIGNWHPYNFGSSTNDLALTEVMRSIIWSGGGDAEVVGLTMSNLQVGQTYKYQLLFGENCCNRGFDVFMDHNKIAEDFSPYQLGGNSTTGNAFISDTFTATSSSVVFGLGYYGGHGDWNPILNAATLEQASAVPVPAALWLFGSALLGLFGVSRRQKNVA